MKENNKGSMIILTVIGIATLLIAVIGATFAYFTVSVRYKTTPSVVEVKSNTMVIEYESYNDIKYEGAIPGRPEEGTNNKLRFKVTSATDMMTSTPYDVYLKITKNEFANSENMENLVFYLYETSIGKSLLDTNRKDSTAGSLYALTTEDYEFKGIEALEENRITGVKKIGVIPTKTDPSTCDVNSLSDDKTACMLKISDGAVLGNQGASDEWYFEVWLKETGEEQNYDQGKMLEASIEIVPHDLQPETNEPDLVNP